MNSIYDPFSGSAEILENLVSYARIGCKSLLGFDKFIPKDINLIPDSFNISYSSSPSNSCSFEGVLTD